MAIVVRSLSCVFTVDFTRFTVHYVILQSLLLFSYPRVKCTASSVPMVKGDKGCGLGMFACDDGSCIEIHRKCDWYYDCEDSSDENGDCHYTGFECEDGTTMIAESWLCDGHADCQDESDEKQENCLTSISLARNKSCQTLTCDGGTKCLGEHELCDGNKQCEDGADEVQENCKNARTCFRCVSGEKCIQWSWVCDNMADCLDWSDETTHHCGPVEDRCWQGAFPCGHKDFCIPQSWRCDEDNDCGDMSDEANCEADAAWDPVYGWRTWSEWSRCNADCGPGERQRIRLCHELSLSCTGKEIQTEECQVKECVQEKTFGCGTRKAISANQKRIVGGTEAIRNTWPWQAQLIYRYRSGQQVATCGGTLIRQNLVLTAAHCFLKSTRNPTKWKVHMGKHTINMKVSEGEQEAKVKKIIMHANFNVKNMHNDLAMLVLDRSLSLDGNHVNVACLDKELDMTDKTHCFVTGWGLTAMKGTQATELQQANIPILTHSQCNHHNVYNGVIRDHMLCAGLLAGEVDACQGDSGGPLICELSDGRWHLVGVTSWGRGCAMPNNPGVYTRVAYFRQWIEDRIKEHGGT